MFVTEIASDLSFPKRVVTSVAAGDISVSYLEIKLSVGLFLKMSQLSRLHCTRNIRK